MELGGSVYIMTNVYNNVYYIGVSSELYSRVVEHKTKKYPNSFTANTIVSNWYGMNLFLRLLKLLIARSR
jgi:predicted GIY-YIG superfamily endonuclease